MAWVTKRKSKNGVWQYLGGYRDPAGRQRSAGSFTSHRDALRAATQAEVKVGEGTWIDRQAGKITFADYVQSVWWPSLHLEVTTKAAYRSNLDTHFLPFFGDYPLSAVSPSLVQAWVTKALEGGLSPRSVVKYHVVLHGIFARAVRDRVIGFNPAADTDLPKVVNKRARIITPEEFERLLAAVPDRTGCLCWSRSRPGCAGGSSPLSVPATSTCRSPWCGCRRPSWRCPRRTRPPASG